MPLSVNSITQATVYEFKNKDQSIYLSKDLCEFTHRRQWPEITLPVPTEAPPQPAPPGPNTQLIRAMQSMHDTAADMLRSQGTDPCAVYREGQVEVSSIMWKVATPNVKFATKSCLQLRN